MCPSPQRPSATTPLFTFRWRLVVRARVAVVAHDLEASDHLTNGEEAEALGEDDTAGGQLGGAEGSHLLEVSLGRL
jgi:hypothetical protein